MYVCCMLHCSVCMLSVYSLYCTVCILSVYSCILSVILCTCSLYTVCILSVYSLCTFCVHIMPTGEEVWRAGQDIPFSLFTQVPQVL